VLATSSNCRMFSSRRLASASGCSRIVAAGASNERDGCCTTIVAWVDRFPPPPALPPFGYEKFTVGYAVPQAHRRCGVTSRRRRGESLCPPPLSLSLSLSLSFSFLLYFSSPSSFSRDPSGLRPRALALRKQTSAGSSNHPLPHDSPPFAARSPGSAVSTRGTARS